MSLSRARLLTAAGTLTAGALLTGCGGQSSGSAGSGSSSGLAAGPATGTSAPMTSAPSGGSSSGEVDPNAEESNPPGDIPDNQAFVAYSPPAGGYAVKVPEGWSRTSGGGAVTFTDKLNSVRLETVPAPAAPTVDSARSQELPVIARSAPGFTPGEVRTVTRKAGPAVLITYQALRPPDPVTGKVIRDDVERYEFWRSGTETVLTLSGPHGSDNVDPWRTVTDSFTWK